MHLNNCKEEDALRAKIVQLEGLLNEPQTRHFLEAAAVEAGHQRARWGEEHDKEKTPEQWYWTLGYLAGKALAASRTGDVEKFRHHLISSAALLANQHRLTCGSE